MIKPSSAVVGHVRLRGRRPLRRDLAVARVQSPAGEGGNITPMIDVLLVLLVIFMAALPLSQRGLDAHLPSETTREATPIIDKQIMLEYFEDRRIEINHKPVSILDLEEQLARHLSRAPQQDPLHRGTRIAALRRNRCGDRCEQGSWRGSRRHHHRRHAPRRPPVIIEAARRRRAGRRPGSRRRRRPCRPDRSCRGYWSRTSAGR